MNKLLLLIILVSNYALCEKQKMYVESTVFFIPKNNPHQIKHINQIQKRYGGYIEIHSSKEYRLLPGGEWNLEIRLTEQNIYNVFFWVKDKNNPEINQNFDVSTLELSTFSLLKSDLGELKINITPKVIEDQLEPILLSEDNFGLNHFCLRNSAIIIDDNFYVGKLTGFAERVEIRLPDFYDIDISLKPLRDWQQIGIYQDGVINIDVKEDHLLTLLNVGIGPSGYQKGGPFKIYGAFKTSTHNRQKLLSIVEKYDFKGTSKRVKSIIMKAKKENKYSVAGITTGNDNSTSKHLTKTVGNVFSDENCG